MALSSLLASCALVDCGDRTGIDGLVSAAWGVDGGADASVIDASRPPNADAGAGLVPDAGASVDAVATCNPQLPPRSPGCYLPSGRQCLGWCMCDDDCNRCACTDAGYSETDIACPPYGTGPACKGPLSVRCNRFEGDLCLTPAGHVAYYCPRALLDDCGDAVCPSLECTFDHTDRESGGTYWCCPQ